MTLTDQQLEARRGRIGSSSIAAILGLSPWTTPFQEWLRLTGRETFEGNDATRLGDALEAPIAMLAAAKLGLERPIKYTASRLLDEWGVATPDFAAVDPELGVIILEIKNVNFRLIYDWNEHSANGYPEYVYAQVQMQMHAFGIKHAAIGACVGGIGPHVWRVEYDSQFADGMVKIARKWWERHLRDDHEPPVDHTDSARDYLVSQYPRIERPRLLDSTPEVEELAAELKEATLAQKRAEKHKKLMRNRFSEAIGDAHGFKTDVGAIKWNTKKQGDGTTRVLSTPRWKGD